MSASQKETIKRLNAVLKHMLTGINQYFLHARMLKHHGSVKLADYEYKTSIGAMKHSDMLVEHILSLGGVPKLQELGKLAIGENGGDMLRNDLKLAEATLSDIEAAIVHCESADDQVTASLLSRMQDGQREQMDFIRSQLEAAASAKSNTLTAREA